MVNGHMGARGGAGMNWEIGIYMYTPPCVRAIASGKLLYSTGSSRSSVRPRGCDEVGGLRGKSKREGTYVYLGLIHFVVQ